ncbi:hypothetical protein [Sorangium sp. So ce861]|uniref:hypothetical protein n=1 Tax=Sorangium sp. So ce861 TaxID=3133323 RepID=UPI003F5FC58D
MDGARDELLAAAVLSADQDGQLDVRDTPDLPEEPPQAVALADQLALLAGRAAAGDEVLVRGRSVEQEDHPMTELEDDAPPELRGGEVGGRLQAPAVDHDRRTAVAELEPYAAVDSREQAQGSAAQVLVGERLASRLARWREDRLHARQRRCPAAVELRKQRSIADAIQAGVVQDRQHPLRGAASRAGGRVPANER